MKKLTTAAVAATAIASMTLTACVPGNNVPGATITGAAAGGLLGAALFHGSGAWVGILAGTLIGGAIGNQVGRYMDRQDALNMQSAVINTPVGKQATWTNRRTKVAYTVRPVRNYHNNHGRYCREYQTTAIIGGKPRHMYGHACRMPDGQWKAAD